MSFTMGYALDGRRGRGRRRRRRLLGDDEDYDDGIGDEREVGGDHADIGDVRSGCWCCSCLLDQASTATWRLGSGQWTCQIAGLEYLMTADEDNDGDIVSPLFDCGRRREDDDDDDDDDDRQCWGATATDGPAGFCDGGAGIEASGTTTWAASRS